MGHFIPANCTFLDRFHGCRHHARRRSPWNPLRWIGMDRPACVFALAEFTRDGRESVVCAYQQEVPRGPPPSGSPAVRTALAHLQQGVERDGDVKRIAELEAALKPFAEIGRHMGRTPIMRAVSVGYLGVEADGLNSHARSTATVADFRAARDVLKRPTAPTSPSKSSGEEASATQDAEVRS